MYVSALLFTYSVATVIAGAKKDIAYLTKFGQPLHSFQHLRGETYDYQIQQPSRHLEDLSKYLQVSPCLAPNADNDTLIRSTLRHPDLQPNNAFVSDELEITGQIDWQHSAVLPPSLQCGIPNSLQNYSDSVSELLILPTIPPNFDELSEKEQLEQVMLLRKRQLHFSHIAATENLNPTHCSALAQDFDVLKRILFERSSDPREGDNVTLKVNLVELTKRWSNLDTVGVGENGNASPPPCPIFFTEEEVSERLRLHAEQVDADSFRNLGMLWVLDSRGECSSNGTTKQRNSTLS
ncbi:hypothetical protein P280DRAFT_87200 [Massarina eburnea CBS 473.64]|uniref:Aminoglycoside phosphotransferase domain-containing protein n=1 Tax=Massarina eburnea CBS 473.64 TaxID=1395130 RepID=A0A6A6RSF0_9PLEO|nr:hypothetical protein P280DRAFT_87200 [Massarina eburnea CBS 473.64]